MFEPCFEHCYIRFGKQYTEECDTNCNYAKVVKEKKNTEELIEELNQPIKSLYDAAVLICMATSLAANGCKNCPVVLENYERRTEYEKTYLHEPCQTNLYKWILDKAKEEKINED